MRLIFLLVKLVILAVVVVVILQIEYRGRKLQTYVVEYAKSFSATNAVVDEVPRQVEQAKEETKTAVAKKVKEVKKAVVQKTKEKAKEKSEEIKEKADSADIPEEDREQLQNFLEKNK